VRNKSLRNESLTLKEDTSVFLKKYVLIKKKLFAFIQEEDHRERFCERY